VPLPWVWGITMERTPAILGSGSRLQSISLRRVGSEGLQNLALSTIAVLNPGLALPITFGPLRHSPSLFHFIYFQPIPNTQVYFSSVSLCVCNLLPVSNMLARELRPVGVCIINVFLLQKTTPQLRIRPDGAAHECADLKTRGLAGQPL